MQTGAAGDATLTQWFFTLFRDNYLFRLFLNGTTLLQCVLAKKKAVANTSLPQFVPTSMEALLHFDGTAYVNTCLQKRLLHAKLHWKSRSQIAVAVQLVTTAWSALSRSIGLEDLQIAYWTYFIYGSRTALLQDLLQHSDCFSLRS